MLIQNSNSNVHVLVLARPADPMCAIWVAALRQWEYTVSVYSTAYEVVNAAQGVRVSQSVILIARPAMLGPQAAVFIEQHFPNLQIIGWVDSGENISDCAIARTTANGMMTASLLDQFQRIIHLHCKTMKPLVSSMPNQTDRLKYELSDEEVSALLGVE